MTEENRILLKRSNEPNKLPTAADLEVGEICINVSDGIVYSKDLADNIFVVGTKIPSISSISTIMADNSTLLAFSTYNSTLKFAGDKGISVKASNATKTITVSAENVDASLFNGETASFYATATHDHDEKYDPQEKVSYPTPSSLRNQWVRIAESTGRANGQFVIGDDTLEEQMIICANHNKGYNASLTYFAGCSKKNQAKNIYKARIVRANDTASDAGKVWLEVYIDAPVTLSLILSGQANNQRNWQLLNAFTDGLASETSTSEYDIQAVLELDPAIQANTDKNEVGISSTSPIYENNQRIFSPDNPPTTDQLVYTQTFTDTYATQAQVNQKIDDILGSATLQEDLNSIKELAEALNNDANAFNTLDTKKANKRGDAFLRTMAFQFHDGAPVADGAVDTNRAHTENTAIMVFDKNGTKLTLEKGNFDFYDNSSATNGYGWVINTLSGTNGYIENGFVIAARTNDKKIASLFSVNSKGALVNDAKVWTEGNDGVGSGLDADLLDGLQGSYYLNASNMYAGILPTARVKLAWTVGDSNYDSQGGDIGNRIVYPMIAKKSETLSFVGQWDGQLGETLVEKDLQEVMTLSNQLGTLTAEQIDDTLTYPIAQIDGTASSWTTARKITLSGAASGEVTFDGTSDVTLSVTLSNYSTTSQTDNKYAKGVLLGGSLVDGSIKLDDLTTQTISTRYSASWYNKGVYFGNTIKSAAATEWAGDDTSVATMTVSAFNQAATEAEKDLDHRHQILFDSNKVYYRSGTTNSNWNTLRELITKDADGEILVDSIKFTDKSADNGNLNRLKVDSNGALIFDVDGALIFKESDLQLTKIVFDFNNSDFDFKGKLKESGNRVYSDGHMSAKDTATIPQGETSQSYQSDHLATLAAVQEVKTQADNIETKMDNSWLVYAMSEVQFEANRQRNKAIYAGSGCLGELGLAEAFQ